MLALAAALRRKSRFSLLLEAVYVLIFKWNNEY